MEEEQLNKGKFEYRVSVIIPVYNVEEYLEACLESLLAQTIPQEEMEVLMINDGSPDGSLGICIRYALEHPNFKVISQENQGVSAARNNGIKNARGRYLLYLDGDDMLSPETAENLAAFFDEHYHEIDILTYPITFCYKDGQRIQYAHRRDRVIKETGIYDVEETLYINLTTVNVMVKNLGKDNHLFDETLSFHEDEAYLTDIVMQRGKLGYVREGEYLYYRLAGSVTSERSNPYYIFEDAMAFYEGLAAKYNDNGKVPRYIQTVILNDFQWKIRSNILLPYHYDQKRFCQAIERIKGLADRIDTDVIINCPAPFDIVHKFYMLSLKRNCELATSVDKNQLSVIECLDPVHDRGRDFAAANVLYRENKVLVVLSQSRIQGDRLYLLAYLKHVAFSFMEMPQLFAVVNGEYIEVPLFLSQYSCYKTKIQTGTFWGFHFEMNLREMKNLRFVVRLRGQEVETKYWFNNKGIQPKIGRSFLPGQNYGVLYRNGTFYGMEMENSEFRHAVRSFGRQLIRKHRKQWLARKYMSLGKKGKKIWLYQDAYHTVDNGYYQFQHDFYMNDGVERYYVCKKDRIDWQSLFPPEQHPYLIERGSWKHKKLFSQAEKILAAYVDRASYVPFDPNTIAYYWDLFHFEVIYLQHGVMHAELPNMYSKEKVYLVDKIVASTRFEKENFQNRLAFREKDIICCGMPRLDHLKRSATEKKLLFAPSWRSYLAGKDKNGDWCRKDSFVSSDYFQEVKAFLTEPRLLELLERTGYRLDIKLHPNFSMYESDFAALESGNIHVVHDVNLGEYTACITDFSSYMYDLFYLGIPVLTHIFDHDRFKAGLHSYRELAWPMETEYPYYCADQKALLELLGRVTEDTQGLEAEFGKYVRDMFFPREEGHAQALYQYLMENR